jgi:DNA-directed RNA polymerase specialized sigma24 family protein
MHTPDLWTYDEPKKPRTSKKKPVSRVWAPTPLTKEQQALILKAYKVLPRLLDTLRSLEHATGETREDLLQTLTLTFAKRLQGPCPWDPKLSPLESYLHMFATSCMANMVKYKKRRCRKWTALAGSLRHKMSTVNESALLDREPSLLDLIGRRPQLSAEQSWGALEM